MEYLHGYWNGEQYTTVASGIMPVVTLRDDLVITGGNGTKDSPYEISNKMYWNYVITGEQLNDNVQLKAELINTTDGNIIAQGQVPKGEEVPQFRTFEFELDAQKNKTCYYKLKVYNNSQGNIELDTDFTINYDENGNINDVTNITINNRTIPVSAELNANGIKFTHKLRIYTC